MDDSKVNPLRLRSVERCIPKADAIRRDMERALQLGNQTTKHMRRAETVGMLFSFW